MEWNKGTHIFNFPEQIGITPHSSVRSICTVKSCESENSYRIPSMFSKKLRIPSKLPIPQYTSKRDFSFKPQIIELTTPVAHEPECLTPNQTISKLALTGLKRGNRTNESIFLSSVCYLI
jgi:hypothetical protein